MSDQQNTVSKTWSHLNFSSVPLSQLTFADFDGDRFTDIARSVNGQWPTLEVTEEHWDAIMDINAKAVFFATQAVLPTMIEQKRGVIVSLASMAGKIGSRANLPYNASKAAVISMNQEPRGGPRCRRDSSELRVPRLRGDGHVDGGSPRAERASQPIAAGVHPTAGKPDTLGANGAPGGRRQRDWIPRVDALGVHDGSGAQR
jgi:hypothetical protein